MATEPRLPTDEVGAALAANKAKRMQTLRPRGKRKRSHSRSSRESSSAADESEDESVTDSGDEAYEEGDVGDDGERASPHPHSNHIHVPDPDAPLPRSPTLRNSALAAVSRVVNDKQGLLKRSDRPKPTQERDRLVQHGRVQAKAEVKSVTVQLGQKRSPGRLKSGGERKTKLGSTRDRAPAAGVAHSTVWRWDQQRDERLSGVQQDDDEACPGLVSEADLSDNGDDDETRGGWNKRIHSDLLPLLLAFVEDRSDKDQHTDYRDISSAVLAFEKLFPELRTESCRAEQAKAHRRHQQRVRRKRQKQPQQQQQKTQQADEESGSETDETVRPNGSVLARLCSRIGVSSQAAQPRKASRVRDSLPAETEQLRENANRWPRDKLLVLDQSRLLQRAPPKRTMAKKNAKKGRHLRGETKGESATVVVNASADP